MRMGIVKSCPGGGRSCRAGWLGGLEPIPDFNPLLQMASGAYLTFLAVSSSERRAFPSLMCLFNKLPRDGAAGRLNVKPTRILASRRFARRTA
jgi:NADPH:quinone reductase